MERRSRLRRARGYTLLELVVTVAVAATVLVLAVPSFDAFVARSRQAAHNQRTAF